MAREQARRWGDESLETAVIATAAADEHQRRLWTLLHRGVVVLALLGACTTGPRAAVSLPPSPAVVEVVEQDYGYILNPTGEIPPGRAVFQVSNRSQLAHDLVLVRLPEDLPPILDQLRSAQRRSADPLAQLPPHPPGSDDAFAVDLAPGRYALLCFVKDETGEPHALKGMAVEFRVSPTSGQGAGE